MSSLYCILRNGRRGISRASGPGMTSKSRSAVNTGAYSMYTNVPFIFESNRYYSNSAVNYARVPRGGARAPRVRVVGEEALKRSEEDKENIEETLKRSDKGAYAESDPFFASASNISLNTNTSIDIDPASIAAAGTNLSKSWSWVPPRHAPGSSADADATHIPVIPKTDLTVAEITYALERLGGLDIRSIVLPQKLDTISEVVVVSGTSLRHLKKMADAVVAALKARGLAKAPGATGAEGEEGDDWILVDCYNILVHCMLPATRAELKLEEHLLSPNRPVIQFSTDEEAHERDYERLMDLYPPGPSPVTHQSTASTMNGDKIYGSSAYTSTSSSASRHEEEETDEEGDADDFFARRRRAGSSASPYSIRRQQEEGEGGSGSKTSSRGRGRGNSTSSRGGGRGSRVASKDRR